MLERIESNPEIMTGKPVIKGTRLTVEHILSLLVEELTMEDIIKEYPSIEKQDILACLYYAQK
jgi:uncharacterized protein (DUF433 family)